MVRFDAYTATMKGPKPDDLMQILFDQVGTAAGFSKTRGFHTFGERLAIKDGSGHEFGAIQWGGRQEDRLMFEVKGEHSQKAAEALRARFEHRVTRVDACADFDAPGAFEALLAPSIEVKKERRIMGGKAGDWDDFPEKGRTLYLGSQSSPVRMRLYEKGLQPEYAHLNRPNWARIEVQVRPAKEAKETFSSLSRWRWGAARWTRDIAAKVLEQHIDPHPAGTTYRLTDVRRRSAGCASSTASTSPAWRKTWAAGAVWASPFRKSSRSRQRAVRAPAKGAPPCGEMAGAHSASVHFFLIVLVAAFFSASAFSGALAFSCALSWDTSPACAPFLSFDPAPPSALPPQPVARCFAELVPQSFPPSGP